MYRYSIFEFRERWSERLRVRSLTCSSSRYENLHRSSSMHSVHFDTRKSKREERRQSRRVVFASFDTSKLWRGTLNFGRRLNATANSQAASCTKGFRRQESFCQQGLKQCSRCPVKNDIDLPALSILVRLTSCWRFRAFALREKKA